MSERCKEKCDNRFIVWCLSLTVLRRESVYKFGPERLQCFVFFVFFVFFGCLDEAVDEQRGSCGDVCLQIFAEVVVVLEECGALLPPPPCVEQQEQQRNAVAVVSSLDLFCLFCLYWLYKIARLQEAV